MQLTCLSKASYAFKTPHSKTSYTPKTPHSKTSYTPKTPHSKTSHTSKTPHSNASYTSKTLTDGITLKVFQWRTVHVCVGGTVCFYVVGSTGVRPWHARSGAGVASHGRYWHQRVHTRRDATCSWIPATQTVQGTNWESAMSCLWARMAGSVWACHVARCFSLFLIAAPGRSLWWGLAAPEVWISILSWPCHYHHQLSGRTDEVIQRSTLHPEWLWLAWLPPSWTTTRPWHHCGGCWAAGRLHRGRLSRAGTTASHRGLWTRRYLGQCRKGVCDTRQPLSSPSSSLPSSSPSSSMAESSLTI